MQRASHLRRGASQSRRKRSRSALAVADQLVEALRREPAGRRCADIPDALFHLFTDLIEAEMSEELARELLERVPDDLTEHELADPPL